MLSIRMLNIDIIYHTTVVNCTIISGNLQHHQLVVWCNHGYIIIDYEQHKYLWQNDAGI